MSDLEYLVHVLFLLSGVGAGLLTLVMVASSYGSNLPCANSIGTWAMGFSIIASTLPVTHQLIYFSRTEVTAYASLHLFFGAIVFAILSLNVILTLKAHYKTMPEGQFWRDMRIVPSNELVRKPMGVRHAQAVR